MSPCRAVPFLALLASILAVVPARAADLVTFESCRDAAGRSVEFLLDQGLDRVAQAHRRADSTGVIFHDPWALPELLPETREFLHAHECAHLALGHRTGASTPEAERAADCWAIAALREQRGYTWPELVAVEGELNDLGRRWRRAAGSPRTVDAEACLRATGATPPRAVPCVHAVPCRHRVPCAHARHEWDVEHAFDVAWNGERIPCRHRRPCEHLEHEHDVAHRQDFLHRNDWR